MIFMGKTGFCTILVHTSMLELIGEPMSEPKEIKRQEATAQVLLTN